MTERAKITAAIAALEAQRAALGDAVVATALGPLHARLAALSGDAGDTSSAQRLRPVTILFTDVVGSTAIASRLDPEEIHQVMDEALRRFTAVVQGHQGRVLQYTGDGFLAAFGAEEAHENDAENAVRAGLAIIETARRVADDNAARSLPGFAVRVGLDTGPVLLGGGLEAQNSIRGNAVNLAARMEQSAPTGGLRISHNTFAQVRGVFDVTEEPELRVKGIDAPVRSYLVQRAKPRAFRMAARGIDGVETRMVGRDAELAQLRDAFDALYAAGDRDTAPGLHAITVVADAGLGKSRLLYEFESEVHLEPRSFYLFKGRALPQTRQQPYALLRDVFAWRLQIADDDAADVARHKLFAGLAPLFDEDGESHVHLLGHLIGFDFSASPHLRGILGDPAQIRARAFHAAAQAMRRMAARGGAPVLVLLDDLHWADDGSLDFIQYLVATNRDMPLLLIGGARPQLLVRRPNWFIEMAAALPHAGRIDLLPLGRERSGDLADALLHKLADAPAALRELITGTSDGNPFFMEEIVKMLLDEGGIVAGNAGEWRIAAERLLTIQVPSTLTGVLQTRLDGLAPAERIALQQASVIGYVFWDSAVGALDTHSPAALSPLAEREFVVAQPTSVFSNAHEFTFQHHLLHQFTYDSVLKRQKREYHARAAAWLAKLSIDRSTEYLGAIAGHYERAADAAQAARYYTLAAESAAARAARESALDHVAHGLALLPADDLATRWRLLLTREKLLAFGDDRARHEADLNALSELAEALADDARRAQAALCRATMQVNGGDYSAAEVTCRRALMLAERAGARSIAGRTCAELSISVRRMGRFDEARAIVEQGLAMRHEDRAVEASLLISFDAVLNEQGDMGLGLRTRERSLALARELGDKSSEAIVLNNLGDSHIRLGDYREAQRYFTECIGLARTLGRPDREAIAVLNLAAVAHLQGDDATAVGHARAAADMAAALGARDLEAAASLPLGLAELGLGHHAAAQAALERSRDLFILNAGPHLALEPSAGLALVSLAQGRLAQAVAAVEPVLDHLSGGGRLDGTEEPFRIRWACHQVLERAGDPRAPAVLEAMHADLQARAAGIGDTLSRQRFLDDVPHHRAIVAAWQAVPARAT